MKNADILSFLNSARKKEFEISVVGKFVSMKDEIIMDFFVSAEDGFDALEALKTDAVGKIDIIKIISIKEKKYE